MIFRHIMDRLFNNITFDKVQRSSGFWFNLRGEGNQRKLVIFFYQKVKDNWKKNQTSFPLFKRDESRWALRKLL